ncbi:MAG: N-acetylmuramoyl-L-alanine amidase [Anaerolineae bacterium]|nr:N-acetylmuramoyl-L-alanine amidase [Anaerolineae bacterium]
MTDELLPLDDAPQFVEDEAPLPSRARRLPIGAEHQPPPPALQSGFVNPIVARVASTRPAPARRPAPEWWLALRTVVVVGSAGILAAFIFSYWTPDSFLSDEFVGGLQSVNSTQGPPTALPSPIPTYSTALKVGVLTGHSGPPRDTNFTVDPGAVCDANGDGIPELTELEINTAVAQRVAARLVEAGYQVEMLEEYDPRLPGYRANALISIHTNTCENFGVGNGASGYNVEGNTLNPATLERDSRLAECIAATYGQVTGLPRHFGRPPDLVEYHVFNKISVDTPTVIVELGFMFENRQLLVERPDDMARGIVDGIDCFLKPGSVLVPTAPSPGS